MTILDVAEVAGVSKSTVSRVINGHTTVAPTVTRQVKQAMNKLGYRPAAKRRGPKPAVVAKRGLTTGNIAFLVLGRTRELLEFPSMARLLSGFTEAVQNENLRPVILEMPDFSAIPKSISNNNIDGLVVVGMDIEPSLADIFHPLPVVWQGGLSLDIPVVDHVHINNRAIGVQAADYFLKRGLHDLAYLNHDKQHQSFPVRFTAFSETASKTEGTTVRQYEMPARDIPEPDMWSMDQMRIDYTELIDQMLQDGGLPEGIFIPTDQQCAIVHTILKERGFFPEKDVITISCNNDAQWLATMHPRPATIDLCSSEQGRQAAKRLFERINNPADDPIITMITPKIIPGTTDITE
jgi:DNA-binding LacI/PurR family transcriptional regulator